MDNWIGHILRKIIEGKIETGLEVTGRKRRRRKQLLDDLKEATGHYKLKEEALIALYGQIALEKSMDLS
jgi:hypothetical protein